MENLKRKLFFWLLVLLFFIVAPLVVLHARGYRFDTKRGVFVYSGSIALKTNPQNFQLLINGQSNDSKQLNRINSSYNITGLLPSDYEIKISQDGFSSWSKKTDVHSGLSSEFWNIILVRDNYERTSFEAENVDRFFLSPRNDFAAYSQKSDTDLVVKILNLSSQKTEKDFSFPSWKLASENRKENIEWSPEQDYLSVPVEKDVVVEDTASLKAKKTLSQPEIRTEKQYNYFIADINSGATFNLNDFLGKSNIRNVRWDPKDQNYVFFLDGGDLFRANILNINDVALIASEVTSFDLSRDEVYFITSPNNLLFRSSLDGRSRRDQVTSYFPDLENIIEKMIVYDDSRIGFIDTDKNLYIYNKGEKDTYFRKLGSSIEGMYFSDDGKKVLFWSDYEISAYFTRAWEVQPIRDEDDLTEITRYSEAIKNVQWFKDYEHAIFSTGRWTKIIELDGRDRRNCADLINVNTETPFIRYDNSLEKLYFTDVQEGKIIIQSIDFPETIPLLGIGG